jgi:hypothetical protein
MGVSQLLNGMFQSARSNQESFQSYGYGGNSVAASNKKDSPFLMLLAFILVEILVLIFGKFLWNEIATKLVPQLKPARTIWQILGLSILLKLLLG